jgi:hypothetical protein
MCSAVAGTSVATSSWHRPTWSSSRGSGAPPRCARLSTSAVTWPLTALDGLLRAGAISHPDLIAASTTFRGLPGAVQLRELAARADGRAGEPAESVLRLHWYDARLPTPTPAVRVAGVRLALGLGVQQFGVVLAGRASQVELLGCARAGWRVLVLPRARVLAEDPGAVIGHLEREFHRHLLGETG